MQIKAGDVDRYLKNPSGFHPTILIYGPDQGAVSERASALMKAALKGNDDPFALLTLESDDIANDPARLADEVGSVALFGGSKVIRVRLSSSRQITKSIDAIIKEPGPDTTVIIEAGDLKKNNPVRSLIEKAKNAAAIPCYLDDRRSLQRLLSDELSTHQLRIEPEAEELLLSLLGENRLTSRNEIQKICLYAHGASIITTNDVKLLAGDVSQTMGDDTVDWIMAGDTERGLGNFQKSRTMGIATQQTVGALQRHIASLQNLAVAMNEGASPRDAVERARPPIHFKRKQAVQRQLTLWSVEKLERARINLLHALAETRAKPYLETSIISDVLLRLSMVARRK